MAPKMLSKDEFPPRSGCCSCLLKILCANILGSHEAIAARLIEVSKKMKEKHLIRDKQSSASSQLLAIDNGIVLPLVFLRKSVVILRLYSYFSARRSIPSPVKHNLSIG